jgi:putative ABC transport system substrate-binding protein
MRRREFVTLAGSAAVAWPLTARAQPSGRNVPLVGILDSAGSGNEPYWQAFREQMAATGWREGDNLKIEIRQASANTGLTTKFAAELVAMKPDVVFANNLPTVQSIFALTHNIPIVFIQIPDPVGSGLVANFAHPGTNITGFTNFEPSIAGKWLEFLKDAVPGLTRVLVLLDPGVSSQSAYEKAIEAAAPTFAINISPASPHDANAIDQAIGSFADEPGGGLIVPPSALSVLNRDRIIALAARYRLPTMYPYRDFAVGGGLMSYGIDRIYLYKEAAIYVSRILKGEADLPVQAPTKFEFAINVNTAKALGIAIPHSMLVLADEVIE